MFQTCSNKHSKSRDNANADFNEISKEHEMLMSQMKVKVFSPKVRTPSVSKSSETLLAFGSSGLLGTSDKQLFN